MKHDVRNPRIWVIILLLSCAFPVATNGESQLQEMASTVEAVLVGTGDVFCWVAPLVCKMGSTQVVVFFVFTKTRNL